jgi:hypothetical protein
MNYNSSLNSGRGVPPATNVQQQQQQQQLPPPHMNQRYSGGPRRAVPQVSAKGFSVCVHVPCQLVL